MAKGSFLPFDCNTNSVFCSNARFDVPELPLVSFRYFHDTPIFGENVMMLLHDKVILAITLILLLAGHALAEGTGSQASHTLAHLSHLLLHFYALNAHISSVRGCLYLVESAQCWNVHSIRMLHTLHLFYW